MPPRPPRASQAKSHTEQPVAPPTDGLAILYDELVTARDRLADLAPLSRGDVEVATQALHEVVWYFLTPPPSATPLLPRPVHAQLLKTARNRELDLYVSAVALAAVKLASRPSRDRPTPVLDELGDLLDEVAFDDVRPKQRTLSLLRIIKKEVDARIAYVSNSKRRRLQLKDVERYGDRENKRERPDQFFKRVYGPSLERGLTQADIRRTDPAFYNVFHVWCSRSKKAMHRFVPASVQKR